MSKQKQLTLKIDVKTGLELLQVLDASTAGYSKEFVPERIERLRSLLVQLDQELEKIIV
jgi:hypothetical protein